MNMSLRRTIHILYEEASMKSKTINSSEHFYVEHSFRRKASRNTNIISYGKDKEKDFTRELRASMKKKNNIDSFYIVLDTDFDVARTNISQIEAKLAKLNKQYPSAKIILSSRSFECWLCMYKRDLYAKPFTSQEDLNRDVKINNHTISDYEKTRTWYQKNADNQTHIHFLASLSPVSYFDVLLDDILQS
ncbi:RloB domain-containing protein [Paenibacillus wenxiniae]|uniref:RloB domain-containing protein n=1 Tax=Paenibacillus wenxiniae TaxID=1636843 RepID=A0ABW4RN11_9BACL